MTAALKSIRADAALTVKAPDAMHAERALVGACLQDWAALDQARELLPDGAAELSAPKHAAIYVALLALSARPDRGEMPDATLLLERVREIEPATKLDYRALSDLVLAVPSRLRAPEYALEVHRAYVARQALGIAHAVIQAVRQGVGAELLVKRARNDLDAIRLDGAPAAGGPVLVNLADVAPQPIRWLWPGRIALGKLTLIAGDPGLGKSLLSLDVAARVTTGSGWPDVPEVAPPGGVVLLSAEDDAGDTIRPRLDAAAADVSRVTMLQAIRSGGAGGDSAGRPFNLADDLPALEEAVLAVPNCRLVVIDPVTAYLGCAVDSHKAAEVRALLAPLGALAARCGVAVLAVTHLNKSSGGPAIYRAMGSLAFAAAARAAWVVARDRDDPRRRLMLPLKNNLAPDLGGLAYKVEPMGAGGHPVLGWERDPVTLSADEALRAELAAATAARGRPPHERREAGEWLLRALAGGPRLVSELLDEAVNGDGIAEGTIKRARKELRIESFRETPTGPWWWRLPAVAQRVTSAPDL